MKLKKPDFWDYKKPNLISYLLFPLSLITLLINKFKNRFTKKNLKIKTICVGNIYLGVTVKTSISLKLNSILKNFGFKTAFIKKDYSDQIDEQRLLKKNGKLFTDKSRINALSEAIKNDVQIAILDDGLQEKKLNYDISFVCFNIENWIGNGLLLPAGPLRENLDSLKKYDAVFLNGNDEDVLEIKREIKKYNNNLNIFTSKYTPLENPEISKNNNYLAFSGIGNPKTFIKTLKKHDFKIVKSLIFPDHYQFTSEDIKKIKSKAEEFNAKIITTEKDFLRLNVDDSNNINYLKIELTIENEKELINFLKQKL